MRDSATRRLEMFIRVREFMLAHASVFTATTRGGELLALLVALITELQGHMASQSSGMRAAREKTSLKSVARAALQEALEAITDTARAMALTMPGLNDKFRLPHGASAQVWLATARAFAVDAEPLKAEFIKRGLPSNFLDELKALADEFEETISGKAQTKGAHVAATAAIDDCIERGMNIVRELGAIVRNTFRDDPALLAEWASASHTARAPRSDGSKPNPQGSKSEPDGATS
jgi:ElaB/YqjD/DUF883 family membrane-anchored ribosome-binding protein